MKFKTSTDQAQFNIMGLTEATIKKRLTLADKRPKPKDHKAARNAKNNWRRNKHKITKGMDKWHKSTDGKRFHRALGRFNSLREKVALTQYYDNGTSILVEIGYDKITDGLLSLSSIETHLLLELQYFEPDFETLQEYLLIVESFMEDVYAIKASLIQSYKTGNIESELYIDMVEIIQLFLDPKSYLYIKRDEKGISNDVNDADDLKEMIEKVESFKSLEISEMYEAIDAL